jgi:hypothetical protein
VLPSIVLPPEVSPVAVPSRCRVDSNRVVCPLGTLAAGGTADLDVTLRAIRPATGACFRELRFRCVRIGAEMTWGSPPRTDPAGSTFIQIFAAGACGNVFAAQPGSGAITKGTFAGDRLVGGARRDTLFGDTGDDCLLGRGGDDTLLAGEGDDRLSGSRGRDSLFGDAGKDRLTGGPWRDRLYGGSGKDTVLAVDGKRDLVRCGPGRDRARVDAVDSVARCERVRRVPLAKRR